MVTKKYETSYFLVTMHSIATYPEVKLNTNAFMERV
jgi:hypothetical protein